MKKSLFVVACLCALPLAAWMLRVTSSPKVTNTDDAPGLAANLASAAPVSPVDDAQAPLPAPPANVATPQAARQPSSAPALASAGLVAPASGVAPTRPAPIATATSARELEDLVVALAALHTLPEVLAAVDMSEAG